MKLLKSLDWDIELKQITCDGDVIPNYQALKRTDNGVCLHISKDTYNPTTNASLVAIIEKFQELSGFAIEGYSEFSGGKKVLGYLRSSVVEVGGHEMSNYLVIGNSHDGTQTTYIGLATIQKPSDNAFGRILKHKIPHTVNSGQYLKEFEKKFEDFKQLEVGLHQKLNQWHAINLSKEKLDWLTKKVLEINPKTDIQNVSTRRRNIFFKIRECVDQQCKHFGFNLLGWFNGIAFYTTHDRSAKEKVFGNIIGATSYFNDVAFAAANKYSSELI